MQFKWRRLSYQITCVGLNMPFLLCPICNGPPKALIGFQNFFLFLSFYEFLGCLEGWIINVLFHCHLNPYTDSVWNYCCLHEWYQQDEVSWNFSEYPKNKQYYFCLHCSPYILFKILNIQYTYVFNSYCMIKISQNKQ